MNAILSTSPSIRKDRLPLFHLTVVPHHPGVFIMHRPLHTIRDSVVVVI